RIDGQNRGVWPTEGPWGNVSGGVSGRRSMRRDFCETNPKGARAGTLRRGVPDWKPRELRDTLAAHGSSRSGGTMTHQVMLEDAQSRLGEIIATAIPG